MYYGLNRSLCDVLEDMRKAYKTYNFSSIKSLIEEAQFLGNRMEAALSNQEDHQRISEELGELRKELKKLRKEKEGLTGVKDKSYSWREVL